MISTKDVVVQYRPNRVIDITDQQIAYIPRLEEDQVECSMPYYIYEGRKVAVNPKRYMLFKLRYLHFNANMNSIKRRNYRSCNEQLMSLMDKKVLKPFMLFINGLFIPWIAISIVINNDDYYLMIDSLRARNLASLCESYEFVQIFSLPDNMYYEHDPKRIVSLNSRPPFMFKDDGTYTAIAKEARYAIVDKHSTNTLNRLSQSYSFMHTNSPINAVRLYDNNEKIKISEKNVFLFVEGRIHYGILKQLNRARVKYSTMDGRETSYLEYYSSTNNAQNMPISIVGNLLSVNRGFNPSRLILDIVFFINPDYTSDNLDNIMRISEESRITAVKSSNNGTNLAYYNKLSTPFDLPVNQSEAFRSHMSQSESFIMGYNPYLYNDLVKSYSNIDIQEFKGSDILKATRKARLEGSLFIGLRNNGPYEERLLIFVNGILHINHDISTIDKNTASIPIGTVISANDAVEIMRFKNINNSEISIVINESDGFIYQNNLLVNDSMRLFSNLSSQNNHEYPEDGCQQFEVDYSLEHDENGYTKIILSDPFYYGKELTIAYKNRFICHSFTIDKNNTSVVNMDNYFKFCVDSNRYMVFVNGRLLQRSQYTIIIPCDQSSGNSEFFINFSSKLNKSDKLDIVYSSTDLEDFVLEDQMHPSGNITVQSENLDYTFSKELYMVWLNGKKVPMSHISDINTKCMRVIKDQGTTYNLRVIKYIKCDTLRTITHNGFVWDEAIFNSGMSDEEINKILGLENVEHTDSEPNYGDYNIAELVVEITNNVCIISDTKNIMAFAIDANAGVLQDPSNKVISDLESNVLYIKYEGSN